MDGRWRYKSGFTYGRGDDYGYEAIELPVLIADLHATILAALGLDHEQLIDRHAGRDFHPTDVNGRIVQELFCEPEFSRFDGVTRVSPASESWLDDPLGEFHRKRLRSETASVPEDVPCIV